MKYIRLCLLLLVAAYATAQQPVTSNLIQINGSAAVTVATGVLKVGVVGSTGVALDAATGAAPPANAFLYAGLGSGATGGLLKGFNACDSDAGINISTATTALIVTGVAGRQIRICSMSMVAAGANNVNILEGTGATCGTGTAGLLNSGTTAAAGYNFAANGGISLSGGLNDVMDTATTGDSVCIITSAAVQLSGHVKYAIY